jgi:hypothetical protein
MTWKSSHATGNIATRKKGGGVRRKQGGVAPTPHQVAISPINRFFAATLLFLSNSEVAGLGFPLPCMA